MNTPINIFHFNLIGPVQFFFSHPVIPLFFIRLYPLVRQQTDSNTTGLQKNNWTGRAHLCSCHPVMYITRTFATLLGNDKAKSLLRQNSSEQTQPKWSFVNCGRRKLARYSYYHHHHHLKCVCTQTDRQTAFSLFI